ncbi:MAG: tRNA uridine-5-carboxymethylaminomethyl(34) synthesis GTPase MnmE [Oscillospiraceae bacterium]|nr:tRNA uridine-5-carboxymethylaminomethyl(34) synthesis GTPase MnmE [Oscillospiraceae bacterium]
MENDVIAAVATPPGAGGIGIIRLSGPGAHAVADSVFRARSGDRLSSIPGYTARLGDIVAPDGAVIDEAVALVYRAPHSYTGEDAAELMCHGGETVCAEVLRAVCDAGARPADRGEFTRRAFLSGRLSLTEAEAVCDLIGAVSKQGERAAAALSHGALRRRTDEIKRGILSVQAHISAYIDFPEEDVEAPDPAQLRRSLEDADAALTALVDSYDTGAHILRGVPTVIVGSPNVGKSTLLNLLAGAEKALVTPVAGTTRDVVEQRVQLGGTALLLADTAGLRDSDDLVERLGIERTLERLEEASLVLAVFDSSRALDADDRRLIARLAGRNAVAVVNKTDLPTALDTAEIGRCFSNVVFISAKDPAALAALDAAVRRALGTDALDPDAPVLANERQRACAARARGAVREALRASRDTTLDVVFALLSEALGALAELSGENVTEAVLDEVFSRFCVGK